MFVRIAALVVPFVLAACGSGAPAPAQAPNEAAPSTGTDPVTNAPAGAPMSPDGLPTPPSGTPTPPPPGPASGAGTQ